MFSRGFLPFLGFVIIWDVAKSFPVQQERADGASVKSALEQSAYKIPGGNGSEGTEFQKTTPIPVFSCFDLDICRTGLDFCSERRKACEKCEDYKHTCGSSVQPVGCTKYCVDLLTAKKLQEIGENCITAHQNAEPSITTEKPPESKEEIYIFDQKMLIIGILIVIIIALLVFIGCRECKRKRTTSAEKPETELRLLEKGTETPIEEPTLNYSSFPPQSDKSTDVPPIPSAPNMSEDISDEDQTKPKKRRNLDKFLPSTNQEPKIDELNGGSQQQPVLAHLGKRNSADTQCREAEHDDTTSSGYTPGQSRAGNASVTNHITINVTPNVSNATSTSTAARTTQPEDPDKNVPFGKQESGKTESTISLDDVAYKNQIKPVSDETTYAQIILRENAFDINDEKNEQKR